MSADPHRRRLLGLFAAAPLAAAAGVQPASTLGRVHGMTLSLRAQDHASVALGRAAALVRGPGIAGIEAAMERVHPLELDIEPSPGRFASLLAGLDSRPASILAQQAAEARAVAAVALLYPPEIATFRSFGAPMRRRLYAELLTRESERLAAANSSPSTSAGVP